MQQITELVLETTHRLVLRQFNATLRQWCEACAAMSNWAPLGTTDDLPDTHQIKTADGLRYFCLNSARASNPATAVSQPPQPRRSNGLQAEAFQLLMSHLDPDWEQAGEKYLTLRKRLVQFFERRNCADAGALADETINRVAGRLVKGLSINHQQPLAYFYAVARYVWLEELRQYNQFVPLETLALPQHPSATLKDWQAQAIARQRQEELLEGLDRCLQELPESTRQLFLAYHQGEKRARIERRQQLAVELGITPNALKIRMSRLRDKLEQRVLAQLTLSPPEIG